MTISYIPEFYTPGISTLGALNEKAPGSMGAALLSYVVSGVADTIFADSSFFRPAKNLFTSATNLTAFSAFYYYRQAGDFNINKLLGDLESFGIGKEITQGLGSSNCSCVKKILYLSLISYQISKLFIGPTAVFVLFSIASETANIIQTRENCVPMIIEDIFKEMPKIFSNQEAYDKAFYSEEASNETSPEEKKAARQSYCQKVTSLCLGVTNSVLYNATFLAFEFSNSLPLLRMAQTIHYLSQLVLYSIVIPLDALVMGSNSTTDPATTPPQAPIVPMHSARTLRR